MNVFERLELEHPVLQAGFAGGTAGPELAAAVSRAGGLGTVGLVGPRNLALSIRRARALAPGRPVAVNLLVPFAHEAHVRACIEVQPSAVVLFFGFWPRAVRALRAAGVFVLHQVGTPEEAMRALEDGADGLIAQGKDAGGHLLGRMPAMAALPRIRAVADGKAVFVAGGVADRADMKAALAGGATGVLCGTRFLATEEAVAHPLYKERVLGAEETIETTLFGMGWPARHRVLPNAATRRWCDASGRPPLAVQIAQRLVTPLSRLFPVGASDPTPRQRLSVPLYTPVSPGPGADPRVLEVAPLYAGESARRVRKILGAEDVVRDLVRG